MNALAFHTQDIPVAESMLKLAATIQLTDPIQAQEVIPRFMCVWVSFNNIYTKLWYSCRDKNGPANQPTASFPCPQDAAITLTPTLPRERVELNHAFAHFDQSLRTTLVLHPSTKFFARRRASLPPGVRNLPGVPRSNGVLNVNKSTATNPIYSPIDRTALSTVRRSNTALQDRDLVAKQVLDLLYTVRNNTFHGGKNVNSASAIRVTKHALTLLQLIIDDFIHT